MILGCPLCQTQYLVSANLFAMGTRMVRCARCRHAWKPDGPEAINPVLSPWAPPKPPPKIEPIPPGSNLPAIVKDPLQALWGKLRWVAVAAGVVGCLLWLIIDRQSIAHRWESLVPLYNAVHLSIYYPGEELEFDEVRSELQFDSGITKLILNGKIKNKTKNNQKVPDIVADALGSDGHVIQSWQIDAPVATLGPGQDVGFSSSINAPRGTVVNINLNFAEMKKE